MVTEHSQLTAAEVVARYVKGAHYPARKSELIDYAQENGAPDVLLAALLCLPNRTFVSPEDVGRWAETGHHE